MKVAVITIAGISSRFNEEMPEEKKRHKIIYYEKDKKNSLLYHLLDKCLYVDKIIIVGGNKYADVKGYCAGLPKSMREKIILVYNRHYVDLASGYSLYLGLKELFERFDSIDEVLFVEGDLDFDKESFDKVVASKNDVLTYSYEPIYANRAVVLYKDAYGNYKYAFNSYHGLLTITDSFSLILNSGQVWKFQDVNKLKAANENFFTTDKAGTNLRIIQNYIDLCESSTFELIGFTRWTNCNTRADYQKILTYWEGEL